MKKSIFTFFVLLLLTGCGGSKVETTTVNGDVVLLETSMGDIKIQLADDMPITAGNFEKLVSEGYYDGVIFHRVIETLPERGLEGLDMLLKMSLLPIIGIIE